MWSDGTEASFEHFPNKTAPWNPGEPNGKPNERTDGAYMYPASNSWVVAGSWDDDDVAEKKAFVCRIGVGPPPSPTPPPMPAAPDGHTFELVKRGVECTTEGDLSFGKVASAAECAQQCAYAKTCRFFIFGTIGSKAGDCYSENALSATCEEGWEIDDFDFYALRAPWVGCTEKHAANFKNGATADDGTCVKESCPSSGGGGGSGGGLSFIGILDLIVLGCVLLYLAVRAGMIYREGGLPALVEMMPSKVQDRIGRSRTSPSGRGLAAADSAASSTYTTSYTAPLPVANVVGVGDVPRSGSSC